VNQDEREGGKRRLLNFGHTFGHALESTTGISHGEAVGIGMCVACDLSVQKDLLEPEKAGRIKHLLQNIGLPIEQPFDKQAVLAALRRDKKRADDKIHFILLKDIGRAVVELIAIRELGEVLDQ
jgi:3-dehydroquinate synthase